ncbi:MAG: hypothetical protein WDO13_21950 [Verrucomicrobiota bacterium]
MANGGFETGTTGWTLFVPGESQGKNCAFDVVTDGPHSGTSSARLQADDFARCGIGAPVFAVQAGERYRVSAWLRADNAATGAREVARLPSSGSISCRAARMRPAAISISSRAGSSRARRRRIPRCRCRKRGRRCRP